MTMDANNVRQFDSALRITIPAELLEAAGVKKGDFASVEYNAATSTFTVTLLTFAPKKVEVAKAADIVKDVADSKPQDAGKPQGK